MPKTTATTISIIRNLITFFFVNLSINRVKCKSNITDNSMSLIPLDNTNNTDNNLIFWP